MIPKILHQIWIGDEKKMPRDHMETWKTLHPTWEYKLWTESEIAEFNLTNINTYNRYYKDKCYNGCANILRVEIINQFGGIYVDADSVCTNPMDDLTFLDFFAVYSPNIKNRVGNAFFGTTKEHPALKMYIDEISKLKTIHPSWSTTGGTLWGKVIKKLNIVDKILPSYSFYDKSLRGKDVEVIGKNYGTHYWGTTRKSY